MKKAVIFLSGIFVLTFSLSWKAGAGEETRYYTIPNFTLNDGTSSAARVTVTTVSINGQDASLSCRIDITPTRSDGQVPTISYGCVFDGQANSISSREEEWLCTGKDNSVVRASFESKVDNWHPLKESGAFRMGPVSYEFTTL